MERVDKQEPHSTLEKSSSNGALSFENSSVLQLQKKIDASEKILQLAIVKDKLNIAGEDHTEFRPHIRNRKQEVEQIREADEKFAKTKSGGDYWTEGKFFFQSGTKVFKSLKDKHKLMADPADVRHERQIVYLAQLVDRMNDPLGKNFDELMAEIEVIIKELEVTRKTNIPDEKAAKKMEGSEEILRKIHKSKKEYLSKKEDGKKTNLDVLLNKLMTLNETLARPEGDKSGNDFEFLQKKEEKLDKKRSERMNYAGNFRKDVKGVWKVGDDHVNDIKEIPQEVKYNIIPRMEYMKEFIDWLDSEGYDTKEAFLGYRADKARLDHQKAMEQKKKEEQEILSQGSVKNTLENQSNALNNMRNTTWYKNRH